MEDMEGSAQGGFDGFFFASCDLLIRPIAYVAIRGFTIYRGRGGGLIEHFSPEGRCGSMIHAYPSEDSVHVGWRRRRRRSFSWEALI